VLSPKPQDNSFSDGIVKLYRKQNTASPGNMPKSELAYQFTLRYHRRTVGMSRFYKAMQYQQQIDEVIRCPLISSVSANDIAEIYPGGDKFIVRQVQYPEDAAVPVMDLALERLEGAHEAD